MFEFVLVFYLFSGIFKDIIYAAGISDKVDITLVSGVTLLSISVYRYVKTKQLFSSPLKEVKRSLPLLILTTFFLWAAMTTVIYPTHIYSHTKLIYFLTILLPISALFMYPKIDLEKFAKLFIYFTLGIFVFYFITSPNLRYYYDDGDFLLSYLEMKSFGLTTSLKAGVAIFLTIRYIKNIYLKSTFIYLFLFLAFYSAARGAFVASLIVLLVYAVLHFNSLKSYIKKSSFILIRVIVAIAIVNVVLFTAIQFDYYKQRTLRRAFYRYAVWMDSSDRIEFDKIDIKRKKNQFDSEKDKSTLSRIWHIKFSTNQITSSSTNLIIGSGFGSYGSICCDDDGLEHPHNLFLEVTFETGIIGLFILLFFFYLLTSESFKKKELMVFSICLAFYFLNMMKSWSIIEMRDFFTFAAILLFYESTNKSLNGKSLPHN